MGYTVTPGSDCGLDPQEETIADVLSRAGYARRSFLGKWHLGHRSLAYHPMNFGFTSFYGHYNGAIDYFTHKREGQVDWHRNYAPSADKGYSTRSEEHTSELQSLMRISYAVFCLKKKNKNDN